MTALTASAPKKPKQLSLTSYTFKGVDMPFSEAEAVAVQAQALCAVVSANLSFRVFEDPEVIQLLRLFREAAPGIIPSGKAIGSRLLNNAAQIAEKKLDRHF